MKKDILSEAGFSPGELTIEESFWVMWYFIEDVNNETQGGFDLSDILSASQPVTMTGTEIKVPVDPVMAAYWNEAVEKYKENGIPPLMKLTKL